MKWLAIVMAMSAAAGEPQTTESAPPAEEKVIPQTYVDHALATGALSGMAEACGVNWQHHYAAFVELYQKRGMSELEMIFMRAYHSAGQADAYSNLRGACTEEMRAQTKAAIEFNIQQLRQ
jgi:hypothetical protein